MRWLGVDGGGTKTAFTLYSEQLCPLDRFELPTCHYAQAGYEGMRRVLEEGVRRAGDLGLLGNSWGIGFGICGYGEGAESSAAIEGAVRTAAGAHPFSLVNDVESAWAAGLGMQDGIVIIAGTGSIAYGVNGDRSMRCGGWDYELGDEGSGGWLGKELLRAFTRQSDGREPAGAILELVRRELGLANDFEIIGFAQEAMGDRSRISALAPLVSEAARQGDPSALRILERAAQEEAELVAAIMRGIFEDAGQREPDESAVTTPEPARTAPRIPVTYIGGTFKMGAAILEPLAAALPERCELVSPLHEPDLGACLLLQRELGLI